MSDTIKLNFDEINIENNIKLKPNISLNQTIKNNNFVELDDLSSIPINNTNFSNEVINKSSTETQIEALIYDHNKPHRETLKVKLI